MVLKTFSSCFDWINNALVYRAYFLFQTFSKYYRGGFEPKMTKREAGLILGVR